MKKKLNLRLLLIFGIVSVCTFSSYSQSLQKQLKDFCSYYEGIYSSKKFSDTTSEKFLREQETIVMPIFPSSKDRWYYYGWFPPKDHEKPLEEIFARIFLAGDSIKLFFYSVPTDFRSKMPWKNADAFKELDYNTLITNGDNGQCNVRSKGKSQYEISSYKHIEQKFANAGRYKYVQYSAVFGAQRCFSSAKFVTAEGVVVLDHKGIFYFDKVTKKYKNFDELEEQ